MLAWPACTQPQPTDLQPLSSADCLPSGLDVILFTKVVWRGCRRGRARTVASTSPSSLTLPPPLERDLGSSNCCEPFFFSFFTSGYSSLAIAEVALGHPRKASASRLVLCWPPQPCRLDPAASPSPGFAACSDDPLPSVVDNLTQDSGACPGTSTIGTARARQRPGLDPAEVPSAHRQESTAARASPWGPCWS